MADLAASYITNNLIDEFTISFNFKLKDIVKPSIKLLLRQVTKFSAAA